jgi:cytochrome c peroxidase
LTVNTIRYLAGNVALTGRELRGLALFNDPDKGNCAACHRAPRGADGCRPSLPTSPDNIGVPRNAAIAANADPLFLRPRALRPVSHRSREPTDLCGAFKVPTLRNVAVTAPYFHSGRFKTLRDVVAFYVRRDTIGSGIRLPRMAA